MAEFDVVIVGGGVSGGLPAAAYLQKAGAKVALVETRIEMGVFDPTYEPWPGTFASPHAAIFLGGCSPYWEDLELERFGLRMVIGSTAYGVLGTDGKGIFIHYDTNKTYESTKKFSEKDAARMKKFWDRMIQGAIEYKELLMYSNPSPEKLEKAWQMGANACDIDAESMQKMNGFQLLEEMFESDYARAALVHLPIGNYMGDVSSEGIGAFSIPANWQWTSGQVKGGNHCLVHALQRVFLHYGGTVIRNSPAEKILVKDGRAVGVKLSDYSVYPEKEIRARKAVISGLQAPKTLELLGEEEVKRADYKLWAKMKFWKSSMKSSLVSMVTIKGEPHWKAQDYDPVLKKTHLVYMFDSWEDIKRYYHGIKDGDPSSIKGWYNERVDFTTVDPSQGSSDGFRTIRMDTHVPARPRGWKIDHWDDVRDELMERHLEQYDVLAPGFSKQVVQKYIETPLDIWRENPIGIPTHIVGGDFTDDQWYLDRMPYRMPIKGLYMANSVWPCPATWSAPGYIVAGLVAEDLGIRNQSWWTHKPMAWFFNNLGRLMVT